MNASDALNEIAVRETAGNPMSISDLRTLANSVDASTGNSTLLLWSRGTGTGFICKQLLIGALAMGFVNERLENHEWQTIDRDRNIVLKCVGGGIPQEPFDFNLNIAGENINFSAFRKMKQLKNGDEIEWQVSAIYAPSHVKQDKSKLYRVIAEALDAFGFAATRENVTSLTVTFAPNV